MPEVMVVDQEVVSQEEANAPWWHNALGKNKCSPRTKPSASFKSEETAGYHIATAHGVVRHLAATSRLSREPRSHIRVIVRLKGGLDLKKVHLIRIAQILETAAKFSPEETPEDIVFPNTSQNFFAVSIPASRNASAYTALRFVHLGSTEYHVSTYMAASDNTCKGVMRGVNVDIDE
ncbi:hypothetical protein HPB51_016300 [Rhipicephalus microplus]|uniref:Uncharacterized protein n=1 Tax=Rhipicephalus microplus TaxID=6941 RepID=A0A9J6DB40_RHIMP|nr:hypothetical protein HPB51_016300 [Rhipicephalus microplus]